MKPGDDRDAALFAAAREGDLGRAREALAAGANVNAVNAHHLTPLIEAAGQGHLEMTRYLWSMRVAIGARAVSGTC